MEIRQGVALYQFANESVIRVGKKWVDDCWGYLHIRVGGQVVTKDC